MTFSRDIGKWARRYFGRKVANLRANGNHAAANAMQDRWNIRDEDVPAIEKRGKRRGKGPHIPATEELPPPKQEKVNRQFVRRADQ